MSLPHLQFPRPPPLPSSLFLPSFTFPRPRPRPRPPYFFSSSATAAASFSLFTNPRPFRSRPPAFSAFPISDQELLRTLTAASYSDSGDAAEAYLPAIRSYETDLAYLTLIGAVRSHQAITAAAADGGDVADEHLSSGVSTMVVETVFPGGAGDDHSTVSTRLFLPAKEVKAKAKKLRSSLTADMLSADPSVSENILAMTFRQVVLQQIWSFKLSLFSPGTKRNMEDLTISREVLADITVSSSDVRILSALAEAICSCALDEAENNYLGNVGGSGSNNMFRWFQKPKGYCSVDSSICVYKISEHHKKKSKAKHLERYKGLKFETSHSEPRSRLSHWVGHGNSVLNNVSGKASALLDESLPAYRLEINSNKFKDAETEGFQELANNRWQALLTHSQMVDLANILDMYYEDRYTLPDKQLSCGLLIDTLRITRNKGSPLKMAFVAFAGATIFLLVSLLAQASWPYVVAKHGSARNFRMSTTKTESCHLHFNQTEESEASCVWIIEKIKDALGWPGDITVDVGKAWIGMLPNYLINNLNINNDSLDQLAISGSNNNACFSLEANNMVLQTNVEDIASFQVVMSIDGKIVGFQPTNRVAVNHWASSPLAKILYKGQQLSPGFLESRLKIPLPHEVYVLELLISVNPETPFALARPMDLPH